MIMKELLLRAQKSQNFRYHKKKKNWIIYSYLVNNKSKNINIFNKFLYFLFSKVSCYYKYIIFNENIINNKNKIKIFWKKK